MQDTNLKLPSDEEMTPWRLVNRFLQSLLGLTWR